MNTLVFEEGRIVGHSTDAAVLDGVARRAAGRPRRRGRCARVPRGACPTHASSRDAVTGRRKSGDADLVVNATSERDEVLVELGPGQTLVDLPYPETATAVAAREARRRR